MSFEFFTRDFPGKEIKWKKFLQGFLWKNPRASLARAVINQFSPNSNLDVRNVHLNLFKFIFFLVTQKHTRRRKIFQIFYEFFRLLKNENTF